MQRGNKQVDFTPATSQRLGFYTAAAIEAGADGRVYDAAVLTRKAQEIANAHTPEGQPGVPADFGLRK